MLKKLILGLALAAMSVLPSQAMARGHGDSRYGDRGYDDRGRSSHYEDRDYSYRGSYRDGRHHNRKRVSYHRRGYERYYQPRRGHYGRYGRPQVRCYYDRYGDRYCSQSAQRHSYGRSRYRHH
jgi:hypothetical protein